MQYCHVDICCVGSIYYYWYIACIRFLLYIVLLDLPDAGSQHFAQTVREVKMRSDMLIMLSEYARYLFKGDREKILVTFCRCCC